MDITEEYEDVLQNLEFPIASAYRDNPQLIDSEVRRALEAVIEHYRAEYADRPPRNKHLSNIEQQLSDSVIQMCEWRLGRTEIPTSSPEFHKTPEELQKCLKRVIKSIDRWGRVGGRQGYLHYMSQFI